MYLKAIIMILIIFLSAHGYVYSDVVWSDEFEDKALDFTKLRA